MRRERASEREGCRSSEGSDFESENERREDLRERAREARGGERTRVREIERERERVHASERSEDARGVAGRAATTGRVDGEISWKSSNARRIAGMSQCVGYGVILRRTRRKMPPGSDCAAEEGSEEDGRGPEGSDFAAEEGGPDAEEGHEEVWDEVQEALSTMEHEEFDG